MGKDKRRLKEDESQLLRQGDITFMSREARRRKAAASYNRCDYAMLPRSAEGGLRRAPSGPGAEGGGGGVQEKWSDEMRWKNRWSDDKGSQEA